MLKLSRVPGLLAAVTGELAAAAGRIHSQSGPDYFFMYIFNILSGVFGSKVKIVTARSVLGLFLVISEVGSQICI